MRDRGVRRAAAVRMFGWGVVFITISATLATAGQARLEHMPARADAAAGSALAPVTFASTGSEQTYVVPAGVTSLEVQAVGANGATTQSGLSGPPGGTGGMVIGELPVSATSVVKPGETLYVAVGGASNGTTGGFNGGGDGGGVSGVGGGGGGGGASDLRTCSRTAASCQNGLSSPLTRLIVAAGGGGTGGCDPSTCVPPCTQFCGAGGAAGQPGGDPSSAQGTGGGAGTLRRGGGIAGMGGDTAAKPGAIDGTGGQGATTLSPTAEVGGGGAGGGYFGGGGGGVVQVNIGNVGVLASGGGGGGANFAALAASSVSFASGDGTPRLLITPRPASAIRITRIYYNSPGPDTGTNRSLNAEWIRIKNTSRTAQQLAGWSITDSRGRVYRFGRLMLRAGGSVTLHTGRGRDTASDRYWNRRGYVWDNRGDLARVHSANGKLADQCRYDDSQTSQLRC